MTQAMPRKSGLRLASYNVRKAVGLDRRRDPARTLDVIAPLEDELGLPVLSSNLVMAWDMARAAGATDLLRGGGRLLAGRG